VPRQRTARLPVLSSSRPRTEGARAKGGGPLRARLVALALVLLSLALITVYFRESSEEGVLHDVQRIGVSILTPFEVAGERVSRPFRDAWGWTSDLVGANDENAKLQEELREIRKRYIESQSAAAENAVLKEQLAYIEGPEFPAGYEAVATAVIAKPASIFAQQVTLAAGSSNGVRLEDPVVTDEGLVGIVTGVTSNAAQVQLLTDQDSHVSARVLGGSAAGIVEPGPSDGSTLVLNRVAKREVVNEDDIVITSGWQVGTLASLYPRGIPIGKVSGVSRRDVDLYTRIQLTPFVDFDSLEHVIVLTGGQTRAR
jgi:rod shape-determining protein MreC